MQKKDFYNFTDLAEIIQTLLGENGCPWDKEQTHESLEKYLIEECYEVIDAINKKDFDNMCEELGDVLLQVMLHSAIAEKSKKFTISDVIDGISKKMITRHPHVFADIQAETSDKVLANWEEIKKEEKGYKTQTEVLESVPKSLPALIRAEKVQKKAAAVGFEFKCFEDALQKVYEETEELIQEKNGSYDRKMEEYGDLLFSVVNISRFFKLNPEFALTNSIEKFINRFEYIERATLATGKAVSELTVDEINSLWNNSKNSKDL